MLLHRIVWAVPFGALIILARRQWPDVKRAFADRRTFGFLTLSALTISGNWLVYTWAVQNGQIFQASLGYYINPIVLVLVGYLFMGERLRRMQVGAVLLATTGVAILTISGGEFPLISITLAISFTVYGVIRKQIVVGAMPGLFVEMLVVFPVAAVLLTMVLHRGASPFSPDNPTMLGLLLLAGPLSVLPLMFFSVAARRLRLSTIGFLQFIGPTGQFLVGYYYGEALTVPHLICFGFIWTAVALFIFDVLWSRRKTPTRIQEL
jgi:chloramphenicol-sensitive protein RarD